MSARKMILSSNLRRGKKRKVDETFVEDIPMEAWSMEIPNDTKSTLDYLLSLFPRQKFLFKLPAIALQHQIYSIVTDRTAVDRDLNSMRENGEIQMIKLDAENDEFAVVKMSDYIQHVTDCAKSRGLTTHPKVENFLHNGLRTLKDVSVGKGILTEFQLTDDMISYLLNLGVLNMRDVKSWWISIPGNSLFIRNLVAGRKAVLSMIKKRRYKEILEKECESRHVTVRSKFGMKYLLCDLIGSGALIRVSSTSGTLLRLSEDRKSKRKRH